jgi:FkbM family methyltransferase
MKSIYAMKLENLYTLWDQYGCEERLRCFADGKNRKFAIYGAGVLGVKMATILKEQFNSLPIAFVDRKAEKETCNIDNIPVYSAQELYAKWGNIPIGVAVRSYLVGTQTKEINEYLEIAGFSKSNIMNIWTGDAYTYDFLYMNKIDRDKTIFTIDILHDNFSKEQYYSYIYSRVWKTLFYAPTYPSTTSYCVTDLFRLDEKDHVLDCGAYDGDTARIMLSNFPALSHITMFEPDADSYSRLNDWTQGIANRKLHVVPKAVSNINGFVGFVSEHSVASRIDDSSVSKIESCRIDDMEFEVPPSFIKMDVEGAELDALCGAEKTIVKHRSILAISAYHKASDIYEIPLYVNKILPDYKLFFRKNYPDYATYDFVMYAIPPERLL